MLREKSQDDTNYLSPNKSYLKKSRDGKSRSMYLDENESLQPLPLSALMLDQNMILRYKHKKRVSSYLISDKRLGHGSFAEVHEGLHIPTGEKVAIKIIDKNQAKQDSYVYRNLRREANIMQLLRHENIIRLYEVAETENCYYMVMELVGSDMMTHITQNKNQCIGEQIVKKYIKQMISAVAYMHQSGIVHRDLKVENILLDDAQNIRIIDFGLSNYINKPDESTNSAMFQTQCGSPAYAAPELLGHKNYCNEVDVWSIGVNMFAMLAGTLPYSVEPYDITALHAKILEGRINHIPDHLSAPCKHLLMSFLQPDPTKRIQLSDAINHPWIKDVYPEISLKISNNFITPFEINKELVRYICDHFMLNDRDLENAIYTNRATSSSCIYHLFSACLRRYYKKELSQSIDRPTTQKTQRGRNHNHRRSSSVNGDRHGQSPPSPKTQRTRKSSNTIQIPKANRTRDVAHHFPAINASGFTKATSHVTKTQTSNDDVRSGGSSDSDSADISIIKKLSSTNSNNLPSIEILQYDSGISSGRSQNSPTGGKEEMFSSPYDLKLMVDVSSDQVISAVIHMLQHKNATFDKSKLERINCKWNKVWFTIEFIGKPYPTLQFKWITGESQAVYSERLKHIITLLRDKDFVL